MIRALMAHPWLALVLATGWIFFLVWAAVEFEAFRYRRRDRQRERRRPGYLHAIPPPEEEERPSMFEGRR